MLKTIVINLERRPARLAAFLSRAAAVMPGSRIEVFRAVDGQQLAPEPQILELFQDNDFNFRRGVIGCALSHISLWQALLRDGGAQAYLIFEDDVFFAADFAGRWQEALAALPRDAQGAAVFDLLFLGGPRAADAINPVIGHAEANIGRGTYAYLISKSGAFKLLRAAKDQGVRRGLDWFIAERFGSMAALTVVRPLCESPINVNSDIQRDTLTIFEPPSTPVLTVSGRKLTVKPVCDWCTPKELIEQWRKMSDGNAGWNHFRLVSEDDADLFLVINRCQDAYISRRSIYFTMEPAEGRTNWGFWQNPGAKHFFKVYGHQNAMNLCEWHLAKTRSELAASSPVKSKVLSSVTSSKAMLPGHRQRLRFLAALEEHDIEFDLYGRSNDAGLRSYRGSLPTYQKDDGLWPYKYTVACENSRERGYVSEKLWDGILSECLTFYWGCPNLSDYVDPDALVRIDIFDTEGAVRTVREALADNLWEKRLPKIREAKKKILNELCFFPWFDSLLVSLQDAPRDGVE